MVQWFNGIQWYSGHTHYPDFLMMPLDLQRMKQNQKEQEIEGITWRTKNQRTDSKKLDI